MKRNESKGITLIALIITIIVMLILVAAVVVIAIDGDILELAKDASNRTEVALEEDSNIVDKIDLIIEIVKFNKVIAEEYTEETYEVYKLAAERAIEVKEDEHATQEEVNAAYYNLIDAKNNLIGI